MGNEELTFVVSQTTGTLPAIEPTSSMNDQKTRKDCRVLPRANNIE